MSRTAVGPGRIASRSGMSSATIRASRSSARQAVRRADELGFAEARERRRSRSTGGAAVRSIGSRGSETGKTSLPDPKNWRDPRHWRFSWREGISVDSVRRPPRLLARTLKVVLAVVTACVALIAGVITADSLSSNDTSETLTVPISTVRAATSRDGYSQEADVAALTPPALPPSARRSHPRTDDGCDHDLPCGDEGRHGATQWSYAGRSEAGRDGDISADGARARPRSVWSPVDASTQSYALRRECRRRQRIGSSR